MTFTNLLPEMKCLIFRKLDHDSAFNLMKTCRSNFNLFSDMLDKRIEIAWEVIKKTKYIDMQLDCENQLIYNIMRTFPPHFISKRLIKQYHNKSKDWKMLLEHIHGVINCNEEETNDFKQLNQIFQTNECVPPGFNINNLISSISVDGLEIYSNIGGNLVRNMSSFMGAMSVTKPNIQIPIKIPYHIKNLKLWENVLTNKPGVLYNYIDHHDF